MNLKSLKTYVNMFTDENECLRGNVCGNGTCTNVEGGFECSCDEGFAPGPMQVCEDVNECQEMGNQCAFRCHNVPGSFRCICPYGYALAADGRHCQDIDECQENFGVCEGGECVNTEGGVICECPEGYILSQNGMKCIDVRQELCYDGVRQGKKLSLCTFAT
ncbi:hypothetical protein J437_LFUL019682 [Ladona fulva]|uniref:EGF-like domain-containing protein n=1 Tax=Ladona fulva TaxID=123851 RepID=A0A8K0KTJ7_LADFU|nr:hypothetical protein J437_LFUL019682 [Ladona fulva]